MGQSLRGPLQALASMSKREELARELNRFAREVLRELESEHGVRVEDLELNVDPDVTLNGRPVILSASMGGYIAVSVDGYGEVTEVLKVLLAGRLAHEYRHVMQYQAGEHRPLDPSCSTLEEDALKFEVRYALKVARRLGLEIDEEGYWRLRRGEA